MPAARPVRPDRLRVVALNVWRRYGAWPRRRAVLADGLRTLDPDLVVFEEAIVTDGYDQVRDLLGPDVHVAHESVRQPDGCGASVASRWPFGEVREIGIPAGGRPSSARSTALLADVRVPEPIGDVLVATYHTAWQLPREREREIQAVSVARLVEEAVRQHPRHVVLAADCNATPDAASMRFWRGRQSLDGLSVCYRDAWETCHAGAPGVTFAAANPLVSGGDRPGLWTDRRIDYVMIRCRDHGPTLRADACARVFDAPVDGVWASDHFGVVADLSPLDRHTS